ncbi:MAG: radical SAM protein [Candidatus Krumholzibacteria bacterium]|nr:radical SAM protein [Candidatus Krumholzibacteria bacterium]
MKLPAQPRYIQIETIIGCDAECPFCPQKQIDRKPVIMPETTWKKIIDDTRGLGITYRPFLQNEALIDKRLARIVAYIKEDATARVEINTNGSLLDEKRGLELIEAGIDIVRFSIDAFSSETFAKCRVGLDYRKVVDNINRFIALPARSRRGVVTEVRMIDMDSSRHEQRDFIEYWSKRADRALIVPLYNWPWDEGVRMVRKPCIKMREEMFFYTDGRAVLCCWDIAGRASIGNVNGESVLEIWNGAARREFAEYLSRGEREKILLCSRCDAYRDRHFDGFDD